MTSTTSGMPPSGNPSDSVVMSAGIIGLSLHGTGSLPATGQAPTSGQETHGLGRPPAMMVQGENARAWVSANGVYGAASAWL